MAYYNQNKKPEELVRQNILALLIDTYKFPKSLIVTEKNISELNTTNLSCLIKRRVDILCYQKAGQELKPLLLIECKAKNLSRQNFDQLEGYNTWIQSPFIALTNFKEVFLGFYSFAEKRYIYQNKWFTIDELVNLISK